MHTHALVNAGVILRGELTVIAETGAQRMFRPGEGIVELVGTRHYGENRGDGELELVMFYAGTQGMSLSERALLNTGRLCDVDELANYYRCNYLVAGQSLRLLAGVDSPV